MFLPFSKHTIQLILSILSEAQLLGLKDDMNLIKFINIKISANKGCQLDEMYIFAFL